MGLKLVLYKKEARGLQRQTKHSEHAAASYKRRVNTNEDLKSKRDQQQKKSMDFSIHLHIERAKSADLECSFIYIELEDVNYNVCRACRRSSVDMGKTVSILIFPQL